MNEFRAGEAVTVKGTVLRTRNGKVELQLGDGQLLRIPFAHVLRAPEEKAVKEAPENKAVTNAPENKSARGRSNDNNRPAGGAGSGGGSKPGV